LVDETLSDASEKFLLKSGIGNFKGLDEGKAEELVSQFRRQSRESFYRGLSFAYALYCNVQYDSALREAVAKMVIAAGLAKRRKVTQLRLIVEAVIAYGAADKADLKKAQNLYSRDVKAIEYLIACRIAPDQVEDLAAKPGEGIVAWSRRAAISRRRSESSPEKEYRLELKHNLRGRWQTVLTIEHDHLATIKKRLANYGQEKRSPKEPDFDF